jgi:hypothetical protein
MSINAMPMTTNGRELSRLLSAAVVNQRFCRLLLSNPATALATGYNGESFRLAKEEKDLVLSIQAKTLEDFARQITAKHPQETRGYPGNEAHHPSTSMSYSYTV